MHFNFFVLGRIRSHPPGLDSLGWRPAPPPVGAFINWCSVWCTSWCWKPRLPSVTIIFTTSTILITIMIHLSSPLYCRPAGWLVLPTPTVPQFNLFQKSLVRFPKNHLAQKIYVCFTCWHNQHIFKCLVLFVLLFQGLYLSFTSAFPLLPLTLMPDTKNM